MEEEIRSDLLIWTAGSRPNSLLASIDVAKDPRGRLEVDRRLRLTRSEASGTFEYDSSASSGSGFPSAEVFCLGDVAAVQGLDLGANAQVMLHEGRRFTDGNRKAAHATGIHIAVCPLDVTACPVLRYVVK